MSGSAAAGARDPLTVLFERAGRDGHTWLPDAMVTAVAPSPAMAAAAGAGVIARVPGGWAPADVADAEDLLAQALAGLVAEGRLVVVDGPGGRSRDAETHRLREGAGARGAAVTVVGDADRLTVDGLLEAVEDLDETALLLLVGDAAVLPPPGPGDPFADLVRSGACPVRAVTGATGSPSEDPSRALDRLRVGLRQGRLTAPDASDRSFVVVPVTSDAQAAHRGGQVATVSIPRAFGHGPDEVAVVTPQVRGEAGRDALAAALPGHPVLTIHDAVGRQWPSVVLVLPPTAAGLLDRALLVSAVDLARDHVSVVHGAGPDLARAVAERPRRVRRTRLAVLLRAVVAAADPVPD